MSRVSLSRQVHFSSGHRYFNPEFSEEKNMAVFGKCYSPHGHGHNYTLQAEFSGPLDSKTGMIVNLVEIDAGLKKITSIFDHKFINQDVPEFRNKVPTTENLALLIFDKSKSMFADKGIELVSIRLYESEDLWVDVRGDC